MRRCCVGENRTHSEDVLDAKYALLKVAVPDAAILRVENAVEITAPVRQLVSDSCMDVLRRPLQRDPLRVRPHEELRLITRVLPQRFEHPALGESFDGSNAVLMGTLVQTDELQCTLC